MVQACRAQLVTSSTALPPLIPSPALSIASNFRSLSGIGDLGCLCSRGGPHILASLRGPGGMSGLQCRSDEFSRSSTYGRPGVLGIGHRIRSPSAAAASLVSADQAAWMAAAGFCRVVHQGSGLKRQPAGRVGQLG